MHFTEVIFSYLNNSSRSTELSIAWAMQLLESGTDITSASELASCSLEPCPDPHQVKNLFLSCVAELGVSLPENWDSEFDAYILCMCNQLAQGSLEPKQFLEKLVVLSHDFDYVCILGIWADLANELNFPSDLFICVGERYGFYDALDLADQDNVIRLTAQQFRLLSATGLRSNFPFNWWCGNFEFADESRDTHVAVVSDRCDNCGVEGALRNMRFFGNRELLVHRHPANKN